MNQQDIVKTFEFFKEFLSSLGATPILFVGEKETPTREAALNHALVLCDEGIDSTNNHRYQDSIYLLGAVQGILWMSGSYLFMKTSFNMRPSNNFKAKK